ncbi:hypothetical protein B0A55_07582 [Friedmanniomyces simplex]|uniref:DNA-directed RNA polymerase III subunit RPC9 n=1 Tax=Friedmanniomyces simplex TaxID=329884 RepID=A0A4U0X2U4_9PEZI|nr:hypothetical protein B0A55_07582 [Friedmanniomyces simplex]
MKILDAGTENLSNQDVLTWITAKRAQHSAENAAAAAVVGKGKGKDKDQQPSPHPPNFLAALTKHERELRDPKKYPYTSNPTVYNETYDAMARFDKLLIERICFPLEEKYKNNMTGMTAEQIEKALSKEQDEKALTETEHLMLFNHAPQGIEQLQPMVENCEERFTGEEQDVLVHCVMEVYRGEEMGGKKVSAAEGVDGGKEMELEGRMEG